MRNPNLNDGKPSGRMTMLSKEEWDKGHRTKRNGREEQRPKKTEKRHQVKGSKEL